MKEVKQRESYLMKLFKLRQATNMLIQVVPIVALHLGVPEGTGGLLSRGHVWSTIRYQPVGVSQLLQDSRVTASKREGNRQQRVSNKT